MLTFFEYINNINLNEAQSAVNAEKSLSCTRELEDIILWYARHLDEDDEFYSKLDKSIRRCMNVYIKAYQGMLIGSNIVNKEQVVNDTLIRVWRKIKNKIEDKTMDYRKVAGLVGVMIRRSVLDILRRSNSKIRKLHVQHDVIGNEDEPRSLSGDPSVENRGMDDILKVKSLTDAEKFVMTKRADGMKNLEIASEMGVVPSYATQVYNSAVRKIKDYYDF